MNIFKQKEEVKYMGNIWGWKVSALGGVLLVALLALMVYRHVQLGVKPGFEETNFLMIEMMHKDRTDSIQTKQ
jgi:hypothetical protein